MDWKKVKLDHVIREQVLKGVSKTEVIKDTLIKMESKKELWYDVIVDLDVISPLRRVEDIKRVIYVLINIQGAEVAFSVTDTRHLPFF